MPLHFGGEDCGESFEPQRKQTNKFLTKMSLVSLSKQRKQNQSSYYEKNQFIRKDSFAQNR